MIHLPTTASSLEILLGGAVTTTALPWTANWVDVLAADQSVSAIENDDGTVSSTSAQTLVPAPSAGHTRTLQSLTVHNADSVSAVVTIRYNNGSATRILVKVTLSPGDTLEYIE